MKHASRLASVAAALALVFVPISNSIAAPETAAPRVSATPAHQALLAIADQYLSLIHISEPTRPY